jgi:hypothetical protein
MDNLSYPIGVFSYDESASNEALRQWICDIELLPERLRKEVQSLSFGQLDTPYRPDGWTIRQVVHHLADSHCNAWIRLKLALTEEQPTICTYQQDSWAQLHDSELPVDASLDMLTGIHKRWATLLGSLNDTQLERTFYHPESGVWTIRKHTAQYAWHSNHHLGHIQTLKKRNDW